jgi:predicted small lipoprotein YifL
MTTVLLLALAAGLSACGRKGPLDPPPSAAAGPAPTDLDVDANGRPIAPPGQKKRIFLDSLLD